MPPPCEPAGSRLGFCKYRFRWRRPSRQLAGSHPVPKMTQKSFFSFFHLCFFGSFSPWHTGRSLHYTPTPASHSQRFGVKPLPLYTKRGHSHLPRIHWLHYGFLLCLELERVLPRRLSEKKEEQIDPKMKFSIRVPQSLGRVSRPQTTVGEIPFRPISRHSRPPVRFNKLTSGTRWTVAQGLKAQGFLFAANRPNTNWTGGTNGEVRAPHKKYSPCSKRSHFVLFPRVHCFCPHCTSLDPNGPLCHALAFLSVNRTMLSRGATNVFTKTRGKAATAGRAAHPQPRPWTT